MGLFSTLKLILKIIKIILYLVLIALYNGFERLENLQTGRTKMTKKNEIKAILANAGVRTTTDSVGNIWTYYGPQVWVSTISQAKRIAEGGQYN